MLQDHRVFGRIVPVLPALAVVAHLASPCAAVTFTDITAGQLVSTAYSAVAWGDQDNDGDHDLLMIGLGGTHIYRNDGGAFFDLGASGLPYVTEGSAAWVDANMDGFLEPRVESMVLQGMTAWCDLDNDGDPDYCQTGLAGTTRVSRIGLNDGHGFFNPSQEQGPPGVQYATVEPADFDGDSDFDLLITGVTSAGPRIARIYRNDGLGTYGLLLTEVDVGLSGVMQGSGTWGDYDSDGDPDILLAGADNTGTRIARVYRNDGGAFTDINAGLIAVSGSSGAWGDYDGDGDLDIALCGSTDGTESGARTRLYRNLGGDQFVAETLPALVDVHRGALAWCDIEGDGDLDLLLTGLAGAPYGGPVTRLYRNDASPANSAPASPTGLMASVSGGAVTLSWAAASDSATPSAGLSYNVYVGSTPGGGDIVRPNAVVPGGVRRLVAPGNVGGRLSWTIRPRSGGTHYWSVQAIDAAYVGSPFAAEQTFVLQGFTELRGALPLSALDASAAWGDMDGDGDLDVLLGGWRNFPGFGASARLYRNDRGGLFSDANATGFPEINYGTVTLADFDNDGDPDVVLSGRTPAGPPQCGVYRNLGAGEFVPFAGAMPNGVYPGAVAVADFNNDGLVDLLVSGNEAGGVLSTRAYRNNGGNSFQLAGCGLPGLNFVALACADYDGDYNIDILCAGRLSNGTRTTRIYRNNGSFVFTDINAGLVGVDNPGVAWGDCDADGDLDALVTGNPTTPPLSSKTAIYLNSGGPSFTFAPLAVPALAGSYRAHAEWADLDGDGDLDIAGSPSFLRNDGGGQFTSSSFEVPGPLIWHGWGDFDGDGRLDVLARSQFFGITIKRNGGTAANAQPAPPQGLTTENLGAAVRFSWLAGSDAETPVTGLGYNVRVGTTPGGQEVVSALADASTGFWRVAGPGNAPRLSFKVTQLIPGPYFWSVQTIDLSLRASVFAPLRVSTLFDGFMIEDSDGIISAAPPSAPAPSPAAS